MTPNGPGEPRGTARFAQPGAAAYAPQGPLPGEAGWPGGPAGGSVTPTAGADGPLRAGPGTGATQAGPGTGATQALTGGAGPSAPSGAGPYAGPLVASAGAPGVLLPDGPRDSGVLDRRPPPGVGGGREEAGTGAAPRTAESRTTEPRTTEGGAGTATATAAGARAAGTGAARAPRRGPGGPDRRIEGLLLGLAAGDAAGWPAARHRAARMPEWTRRLTRELDTFAEQNATTTLPVPIALNQPPEPLRLGPSDDAEWAAFTAGAVLTAAGDLFHGLGADRRMRAAVDLAWNSLASEIAAAAERAPEVESAVLPLRARISVRAGLGNLAAGLRPPATGHDNPHFFDDAACVRAVVLAVVHPGDPDAAAELAEFDARYTQDGDGVHGARAMAAAVATALGGGGVDAAVEAALGHLPGATEIGRNARHAVKLARNFADEEAGAFALVPLLEHQIVDHVYSYGIAAAETVPVALALTVASGGRVSGAVPAAACLSRVADSAPALAGALTGALGGGDAVPAAWRDACRTLAGCALPRLAGIDLIELAGLLADTELTSPGGQFRHDDPEHPSHPVRPGDGHPQPR